MGVKCIWDRVQAVARMERSAIRESLKRPRVLVALHSGYDTRDVTPDLCYDMPARAGPCDASRQATERRCPDLSFSRFPQPGIRRRRSGADIATTFRPPPTRRRSTNCWKRFPRWRSIYCRTIMLMARRNLCSYGSRRSAKPNRPRAELLAQVAAIKSSNSFSQL
jgi:hypothetical protein